MPCSRCSAGRARTTTTPSARCSPRSASARRWRRSGTASEPLEVRIGIATGEVVTTARPRSTSDDLALTGGAITTAARIQSLARPGEILLDAATVAAARGRLVVADRGSVVLRGQSEPVSIHALEGELGLGGYGPPRPRAPGRLVGRAEELAQVRALLDRASATGAGGVVLVVGEAGIGKTRLLAEIETEARERGFAWTWTENTSYGQSEPYRFARVFAQAVADEHGVDSGSFARTMLFTADLDEADVRRYGGAVAAIARDAAFSGWEAEASDTPADPTAVTATLAEVAARYIDRIVETAGPRVVVIDDHHWMDPSSVGLVELLVDRAARAPLVVFVGTRPGSIPAWVDWPTVERDRPDGARHARDRPAGDGGRPRGPRRRRRPADPRADRREPALRHRDRPRPPRRRHAGLARRSGDARGGASRDRAADAAGRPRRPHRRAPDRGPGGDRRGIGRRRPLPRGAGRRAARRRRSSRAPSSGSWTPA